MMGKTFPLSPGPVRADLSEFGKTLRGDFESVEETSCVENKIRRTGLLMNMNRLS